MQIKNFSNTNFQASRVLSVKRNVATRKEELIEVFRLDKKTDTEFIKNVLIYCQSLRCVNCPYFNDA